MAVGNVNFESIKYKQQVLSKHALKRSAQRGISLSSVPLIKAFGEQTFDGHGALRYVMTDRAIKSLREVVGSTQKVDSLAGVYAVISVTDNTLITLAHLY